MVREVVSAADRAADVGRGAGAAQFHSLLARYCSGVETDADVDATGLFRSEPAASGAARTGMVFDGAWRWWSTSSSRALCLRQGECREASLARAQAPVSGTGPFAVPAGRHQDLIRHTWTTHR